MQKERNTCIQLGPGRVQRIDLLAADMTKASGVLARRCDVINALVDSIEHIDSSILFQNHNCVVADRKRARRNRGRK